MNSTTSPWSNRLTLLAINLLFLMVWGFTGIGKIVSGYPAWFPDIFGKTILATLPGLQVAYWMLAASETAAFVLAFAAIVRLEFLGRKEPAFLQSSLVLGLFNFVMLSFGKWLTDEFTGTFQLFTYFAGTLLALRTVRELR